MKPAAIEITGLSKYYGKARGIENVDLEVQEGEVFGFIGPNGAGKSTTIRILLNLIFPTGGAAKIMGMDVTRETRNIRKIIGYVPSDANAYANMDVNEFLHYCMRFYGNIDKKKLSSVSEMFDMDLTRRIGDLSMGNRKKVAIIQGIIHSPRLLILDEPTTGLDPLMQAKFFDLLRSENQRGMTIFFSSHILSEIQQFCKRVAIIRDGRIVKVEDIETLRRKQLKKINIVFENKEIAGKIDIKGIDTAVSRLDSKITFMYSGTINELLARLATVKIEDMTIEEPSLEEIFMHYYK